MRRMKMSKCNQDDFHEDVRMDMDCPCEPFLQGSMDIIIEEQQEDGTPDQHENTRYVKVCGSVEDCRVYPLKTDGETGIGSLHLEEIQSVKNVLVLVDENGQQIMDQDAYEISYYVNGEEQQEDHAAVVMSCEEQEHHEVRIVIRHKPMLRLHVTKQLRDACMELQDPAEDMRFTLHLCGMGISETIVLDAQNDFSVCVEHLYPGVYTLEEEEVCGYGTVYRFDDGEETETAQFELISGTHDVQVINQQLAGSVLTIDKYIRDEGGELIKPQDGECFEVRIIGDQFDAVYTLTCENDFFIELRDLEPGFYDVSETSGQYETSYLVNHQMESGYAHVEVRRCEASSVLIINTPIGCSGCESPLRICKFIRRCDGLLVRPDDDACFKVMLCGCGFYQTFNLNACNNFCVDIDNICCGEYEIREIDNECYKTSYIINDGCERTSAYVCLHENECNVISIINEERNKGCVSICKFIRNERGDLVKPMKGDRFVVTLRSFFFRETFVLDEHNDWCMHFDHLREGSYEVRERSIDGYDTTYIVNGCKERKRARFIVDGDCGNEVRIVNTPCRDDCGTLKVCKYMELQNGELVKPDADESFEFSLQGPCTDECFTLHARNHWCVILEGLKRGDYTITEQCAGGYDVRYLVNGCPAETAEVCMNSENQEVSIINTRPRGGNLTIEAWIRDCEDVMWKPCGNACFEIYVEHRSETRSYTLDARNRWRIMLDDLEPGKYRIIQKDSYGYEVSYEIQHEEMAHGAVELDGNDQTVKIVNSLSNCQGMVTIEKTIVDACGNRTKPCPNSEFTFLLRASGLKKRFTLDDSNDFCVYFDDLREGMYHLEEETEGYEVSYIVNGIEADRGQFVLGREDIHIEVRNTEKPQPALCVEKRIRKQGRLCMPEPCESYEFVLTGKDVHEVYTLDVSNDFTVCLCDLCRQHYEIRELHVNGCVSYLIDDSLQADGYFLFDERDMNITIINEEGCDDRVRICKVIEENDQQFKPYRWESFDIQIEGRNYKNRFTLDCDNGWCIDIDHLAPGNYQVRELGDYDNSFMVNGECSKNGSFFVGSGDTEVTIINHVCCSGTLQIAAYDVDCDERCMPTCGKYSFVLSTCDWQQTYTLSRENDWSLCFDELPSGDYTLAICDDHVRVEIDGESGKKVSFHLECETKAASLLIMPQTCRHTLVIDKKMRDANGNVCKPEEGMYQIEVCGEEGTQTFCLQENNDYCVETELSQGEVTVSECGYEDALYQFNGGPLHKTARFRLCMDSRLTVFNRLSCRSSICIQGTVENCEKEMVSPRRDDCFQITLKGESYCDTITLNRRNSWCACFDDVPAGRYELSSSLSGYESVSFEKQRCAHPTICVDGDDIDLDAVYKMSCHRGSIEILKYRKDGSCGCFVRPCQNESYDIHVWSDHYDEVIVLNRDNAWRKRLTQLPDGTYHVEELHSEDEVSYIVNGGKESETAIVEVHGNTSYVKVLNAKRTQGRGSIEICKFIKGEGMLERPQPDASYTVLLKGPNGTKTYDLNEDNDFCVTASSLPEGTYEVVEDGNEDKVSYIVNNGCETNRGIVHVMQNHNCVQVLNKMQSRGSLLISKFVKGEDGKLHTPDETQSYRVHVSKANFNEIITLSKENDFKEHLRDLDDGWYVVDELDHEDVTYRINGGSEVDTGAVRIRGDEQDVWIINPQPSATGSITVTKYMRTDQHYHKPADTDVFRFHMSRPGFNEVYTLNKENNWTQVVDYLEDGSYVLQEVDSPYEVSYVINGGSETNFGIVDVRGNDNTVFMINTTQNVSGSIRIMKYIRAENGQLERPTGDFRAQIHVSRPGFNQFYDLTSANDWTVNITGLENGQYVLDEVDAPGDVTYIINGGSEVQNGIVRVQDNANQVHMINSTTTVGGSIRVVKYIRAQDGQLIRPQANFTARLHVSRPGFNQFYDLTSTNDWTVNITGLENGQYVLDEADASGDVTYIINGGSEVQNGIVRVQDNANQVQMINQETASSRLYLQKYKKDGNGNMLPPDEGDEFRVHITSYDYDETVVLNAQNEFQTILEGLAPGSYAVEELNAGGYRTTYRINGAQETENAIIEIIEGSMISVDILNEEISAASNLDVYKYIVYQNGNVVKPNRDEVFRIRIFNNDVDETYTLDETNRWHLQTQDLPQGTYQLEEISQSGYRVQYQVNGGASSDQAQFTVSPGVANFIEIMNTRQIEQDGLLEMTKRVRSQDGELVMPSSDQSFEIRLYNNMGYSDTFTLESRNRFTMRVASLTRGVYHVEEMGNTVYDVTYMVNGGTETSDSRIVLDGPDVQTLTIINTRTEMFYNMSSDNNLKIVIE